MDRAKVIYLFAGEKSGDDRGAELGTALLNLDPSLKLVGVAGPKMRALGIEGATLMEEFEVMGFIDVVFALPRLIRLFRRVKQEIVALDPAAIIFIDYPGFNIRMAKALFKMSHGAKRIHYICPSVWAWGKKRIGKMTQTLDLLISIFPFEKKFFKELPVHYAGHPLAGKQASKGDHLVIFPGSREKEIARNLPLQIAIAKTQETYPIAISCAAPHLHKHLESFGYPVIEGGIDEAAIAIATSGTITLELALAKVPTLVTYAITKLDLFLAQKIFRIKMEFYSLPNIVAGHEIFPELFGPAFTLENGKEKLKALISGRETAQNRCESVIDTLGAPPTADSLAGPILKILDL